MTPEARAIRSALDFRMPMLLRNVEPLEEAHLDWVPGPQRNSIRWQLWHIAEVEDNWIRQCMLKQPARYPFTVSLADAGDIRPTKDQLLAYLHEVRALTHARLEALEPDAFDRIVHDPDFADMSLRDLWAGVVTSFAWHAGQIALTAKLLPDSPITVWTFTPWDDPSRTQP